MSGRSWTGRSSRRAPRWSKPPNGAVLSRAFVKDGDSTTSGSLVDRFYQGLLGLSEPARILVGKRQQQAWLTSKASIEAARRAARGGRGADPYREIFEAAAERAGDPPQSPTWWAAGDAATAL